MHEILTPEEMGRADRLAVETGGFESFRLMLNAGAAVAAEVLARFPDAAGYDVLCGPGNNGGDGYVIARLLRERGLDVNLWRTEAPRPGSDAARAAEECPVEARPLDAFEQRQGRVIIDALFGAGLARPVEGIYAVVLEKASAAKARVVGVDLPSGVSGDSGAILGTAIAAELTVTFFRKKPGHLLYPGRALCGETVVADIGIGEAVLETIRPHCRENHPAIWATLLPRPEADTHKYRRGHVAVFSGGPSATGAARLAARGALRIGAGAVTVLSPAAAMAVNAMHLTAIMLRRVEEAEELAAFQHERVPQAYVLGPAFGVGEKACAFVETLLRPREEVPAASLVLDADGITSFADSRDRLFEAVKASGGDVVLTPHLGEFKRLFPDLAADGRSKLEMAREAARMSGAIVLLKGPDTVIAAPDGETVINANGTPYLATAGSGDVLAGIIAGLLGQGMPAFAAACAAVYLHAEAGRAFGPGLIAEDLPEALPAVLRARFAEEH